MRLNKIILPILFVIFMAGIVSASATFKVPVSSDTVSGKADQINITCGLEETINATVTGTSVKTGDTLSAVVTNSTPLSYHVNGTFDTRKGIDSTDWILSCTCYNRTGSTASCTQITGITIDNTDPTCSQTTLVSNSVFDLDVIDDLSVTCTNATSATVACDSDTYSMIESSDICTYDYTDFTEGVCGSLVIKTSDGTDTTTCTRLENVDFEKQSDYDTKGGSTPAQKIAVIESKMKNNKMLIFGVAVFVIIMGAAVVVMRKK